MGAYALLVTRGEQPVEEVVHASAKTGLGLDRLIQHVTRRLDERSTIVDVCIPVTDETTVRSRIETILSMVVLKSSGSLINPRISLGFMA